MFRSPWQVRGICLHKALRKVKKQGLSQSKSSGTHCQVQFNLYRRWKSTMKETERLSLKRSGNCRASAKTKTRSLTPCTSKIKWARVGQIRLHNQCGCRNGSRRFRKWCQLSARQMKCSLNCGRTNTTLLMIRNEESHLRPIS